MYFFVSATVLPAFEVSIDVPSFGVNTDKYLAGTVKAR